MKAAAVLACVALGAAVLAPSASFAAPSPAAAAQSLLDQILGTEKGSDANNKRLTVKQLNGYLSRSNNLAQISNQLSSSLLRGIRDSGATDGVSGTYNLSYALRDGTYTVSCTYKNAYSYKGTKTTATASCSATLA